ncbi:hypothetical protein PsalN5692_01322 [Piscirickettsia salmonis]|uniref:YqcC family protein n=1 Tax=Piscirickettsia salmonis TaxID=1238 RepID=UPI0012B7777D|nr:YqcC family protein [Piscirickettsia salmonis]QGP49867.1 hypothetical protein PsalN5692_01322 [Piscirickettsia salmonis]
MNQTTCIAIASLLQELEKNLREQRLWEAKAPCKSALLSQEPFCVDTLHFSQWVQWIFLPRMKVIIAVGGDLPLAPGIAPMAEAGLQAQGVRGQEVIRIFKQFDQLLA